MKVEGCESLDLRSPDLRPTRNQWLMFVAIVAVAAILRLVGLESAPPGINHDEASNGYDAYSILKTGQDRWGESWPVLLEGFGRGDYRGALYAYLIVPFHAIVGPKHLILSTRLPAAIVGVLTVGGLFALVTRTSNVATALWAAFFLTLSPWHIQLSRFGHEASLTPACGVFALLLVSTAGLPLRGLANSPPRLSMPLLVCGGVVAALSVYTYGSMRVFMPLLTLVTIYCYREVLAAALRARANRATLAAAVAAAIIVLTPMAWLTVTEWNHVTARALQVSVFHDSESLIEALVTCAKQFAAHFGPSWLVTEGDPYIIQSPRGFGQLNACLLPFLLLGMYFALRGRRAHPIHAILLGWLAIHPLAAAVSQGGPHALRSACGLPVFQWIAAIGCHTIITKLCATDGRRRLLAVGCASALIVNAGFFTRAYFVDWANDPRVAAMYQEDLCDAMREIRPMVAEHDRVFISDQRDFDRYWHSAEAYIVALLVLPIAPEDFHTWTKMVRYERPTDGFHRVDSFGPFVMTTLPEVLDESFRQHPGQSALIVTRPGQIHGGSLRKTPAAIDGRPRFEIISARP